MSVQTPEQYRTAIWRHVKANPAEIVRLASLSDEAIAASQPEAEFAEVLVAARSWAHDSIEAVAPHGEPGPSSDADLAADVAALEADVARLEGEVTALSLRAVEADELRAERDSLRFDLVSACDASDMAQRVLEAQHVQFLDAVTEAMTALADVLLASRSSREARLGALERLQAVVHAEADRLDNA